jgi:hypothetical protein
MTAPVRLTPRGGRLQEAVSSAARTLAWSLVAFFVGLALVKAAVHGLDSQCDRLIAAHDLAAAQRHGCADVVGGTSWTRMVR